MEKPHISTRGDYKHSSAWNSVFPSSFVLLQSLFFLHVVPLSITLLFVHVAFMHSLGSLFIGIDALSFWLLAAVTKTDVKAGLSKG